MVCYIDAIKAGRLHFRLLFLEKNFHRGNRLQPVAIISNPAMEYSTLAAAWWRRPVKARDPAAEKNQDAPVAPATNAVRPPMMNTEARIQRAAVIADS